MFRDDHEFSDEAGGSHLASEEAGPPADTLRGANGHVAAEAATSVSDGAVTWAHEAERELKKIPFFVRGKARRNTESFARDHGRAVITVETLYDAKAHFGR
jgi:light-independent protochlorophyllide reductase subunit B